MTPSGLTFFSDQFATGEWEGLTQFVGGFNRSSGNAIRLVQRDGPVGRREDRLLFDTVAGLVTRRDPGSSGTVAPVRFSNKTHTAIKVYRNSVLDYALEDFLANGMDTREGQRLWGLQWAAQKAENMLNTGISALVGGIQAIGAPVIHDATSAPTPTLTHTHLNQGFKTMGDASPAIRSLLFHSDPWHDLIGDALVNQQFAAGGMAIFEGTTGTRGRIPLVTDSPPLFVPGDPGLTPPVPDQYLTLGLVEGALSIEEDEKEEQTAFGPVTGSVDAAPENITVRLQVNWSFTLRIKGVRWNQASVDNPDLSTLAAAANWSLVAASHKLGPGFAIRTT